MAPRATSKRLNSSSYQGVLCYHLNSRVSGQVQTRMLLIVQWRDATDCHLNSASGLGHSFPSSWSVASWGLRDPFPEIVLNKMKLSAWLMILSGTAYIQRLVQTEKKKKGCPCLARRAGPPQLHDLAEAFVDTASQFKFSLCLIFLPLLPPSLRIFPINFLYTNLHLKVCFPEDLIWDVHLREKIQNTCHNCCKPVLSRMGFMEKVKP